MSRSSRLRDSTQIVLPCGEFEEVRETVERRFTVTVFRGGERCRIIGSPVEIKGVSDYLTRQGISVP